MDHIKVEVPKASSEDGKPEKRTSGRKRTTKAEKDAELAAKAKKPKKAGPSERTRSDVGCGQEDVVRR